MMRDKAIALYWRWAYRRIVRSSFATVPLYRERWALDGRTDPVLVPGRTGTHGGAIEAKIVAARMADLVPLAGGAEQADPQRGREKMRSSELLTDPLLGVLGGRWRCGHMHVDWPRIYVRTTTAGLAFTVLWQASPRLVDVLTLSGELGWCPLHGSPVVLT